MVRLFSRLVALVLVAGALACADTPAAPQFTPSEELTLQQVEADIHWVRGCPTIGPINAIAIILLAHNNPDRRWVVAQLANLDNDVRGRRRERIQARAHAIVDWLLDRQKQGKFRGTDAQLTALINAIYCFAGIDISLTSSANSELVLPGDAEQIVATPEGAAGVQLPANAVAEPTVITVESVDEPQQGGFLDTKLDQYPGFVRVTKQSVGNTALTQPVVVGVCADGVIPAAVRNRLRLGHGKATGFEIAAPGDAGFLSCPNQVASAAARPLWKRLAASVLPAQLHAFQDGFAGGGVGGTVTEFSPFAPVDPQLEFGGGVGGTVTEFIRIPTAVPNTKQRDVRASLVADPCTVGMSGAQLSSDCVPSVRITTRLGTPFVGVPVTWDVTAGNGTVAGKTTVCGGFGATAVTTTNADGRAGICWTLGAVGLNSVRATPGIGGDAPAGVVFVPGSTSFSVTAAPRVPTAMVVIQGGEPQRGVPIGGVVPVAPIVLLTDSFGNPVPGVNVGWEVLPVGTGGDVVNPTATVTGADGRATTTWTLATGAAKMFAFTYVLPDGSTSLGNAPGAVKLFAIFDATTAP